MKPVALIQGGVYNQTCDKDGEYQAAPLAGIAPQIPALLAHFPILPQKGLFGLGRLFNVLARK